MLLPSDEVRGHRVLDFIMRTTRLETLNAAISLFFWPAEIAETRIGEETYGESGILKIGSVLKNL